jgi:hypothetical protein
MNAIDELVVPILGGFVSGASNGKHVDARPLPLEFRHFAVAERLAEGRKSFEQVADLAHRRRLNGGGS